MLTLTADVAEAQLIRQTDLVGKWVANMEVWNGRVFGAGTREVTPPSGNEDVFLFNLDAAGDSAWTAITNGPSSGQDAAQAMAMDHQGNVYIAGFVNTPGGWWKDDTFLAKYSPDGVQLWNITYNGDNDHIDRWHHMLVDENGNVYVSGNTQEATTGENITLAKYDTNGELQWMKTYDSPTKLSDRNVSLHFDPEGNLVVGGTVVNWSHPALGENLAPVVLKYDRQGNLLYEKLLRDNSISVALTRTAVDADGNVYLLKNWNNNIYLTISKLDPSGEVIYDERFMPDSTHWRYALRNFQVDAQGRVVMTATVQTRTAWPWTFENVVAWFDPATGENTLNAFQKTDSNLDYLDLLPDASGNLYTTRIDFSDEERHTLLIQRFNPEGDVTWSYRLPDLAGNAHGGSELYKDFTSDIELRGDTLYVTYRIGSSRINDKWLRTVLLDTSVPSDVLTNTEADPVATTFRLEQSYPNPFTDRTTLRFDLAEAQHVRLTVHDVLGRTVATLVDRPMASGEHRVAVDAQAWAPGIYFYRLEAGGQHATGRMVRMR